MTIIGRIRRGKYGGWADKHTPKFKLMPALQCLAQFTNGAKFAGKFSGFDPITRTPTAKFSWICCNGLCTRAEELANDCYKRADILPGGISKRVALYLADVSNCYSAYLQRTILNFDSGSGTWIGQVTLRGGILYLTFKVLTATSFRLSWTGCDTGSLTHDADCTDPLGISFGQETFIGCCRCNSDSSTPPSTDNQPTIFFFAAANCHKDRWAKYGGWKDKYTPIFRVESPCIYDIQPQRGCSSMTCPLIATISGSCPCMNGDYGLSHDNSIGSGGGWEKLLTWGCGPAGSIRVTCLGGSDGTTTYQLDLLCGADNTGTAQVVVPNEDIEDFDETFMVPMTSPGGVCTGVCTYTYIEMTGGATLAGSTCSASCDPCDGSLANGDPRIPGGLSDGQTFDVPCTGSSSACCVATIPVRVTRAA